MQAAKVQFELAPPEFDTQGLVEVAISVLPPLLLLGGLFFLVRHPSPTPPTSPPTTPLLPSHLSSHQTSPPRPPLPAHLTAAAPQPQL